MAALGVFAGHRLSNDTRDKRGRIDDAGPVEIASLDAAAAGSSGLPTPVASTRKGSAKGNPSVTPTPSVSGAPVAQGGLAGTGAPLADSCICLATHEGGTTGVCHPQQARAPVCQCKRKDHANMCWASYKKEGQDRSILCPERKRTMESSSRDGDACTAFPESMSIVKNPDGGKSFPLTSTGPAETGQLETCNRCPGPGFAYPRTPGAPCVGIASGSGSRVEGKVVCN